MNRSPIHRMVPAAAAFLAMLLAVLVRIPPVFSVEQMAHTDSLIDKEGRPYFLQPDAYYHVRMGDEIAKKGSFGMLPDQTDPADLEPSTGDEKPLNVSDERIDPLSFAPEGHPAVHQEGIVRVAIAVWKVLSHLPGIDISLHTTEYYLSCLFAALTALVVFLLGRKLSNTAGGLFAAVFAVCAPAFVFRTAAGTFDTDMVQPLFTVLMVFLILESVCAFTVRYALLMTLGAATSAEAYMQCWGSNALAFILIAFAGGAAALMFMLIEGRAERKSSGRSFFRTPGLIGYGSALVITGTLLLILHGPVIFGILMTTFQRVNVVAGGTQVGVLPDPFAAISELKQLPIGPWTVSGWLWPGKSAQGSVVGGLGGILVLLLAPLGLTILLAGALRRHRERKFVFQGHPDQVGKISGRTFVNIPLSGLIMLVVWIAPCIYAIKLGGRFVEHLAFPAGILAGCAAGKLAVLPCRLFQKRQETGEENVSFLRALQLVCSAAGLLFCITAASVSALSAWKSCANILPSACDAHESAMDWIAQNARSPEAVIASWWDQGFFYEYESGHPVLWDGVTQDSPRAVLLGKALITDNKRQSRNLLQMLSGSGNTLYEELRRTLGIRNTCNALFTAATMTREEAEEYFRAEWALSPEEAKRSAGMLHLEKPRETYLVLSTSMLMRLGYIEFYGNWDFTGDQRLPVSSTYYSHPSGFGEVDQDKETEDPFSKHRQQETIWQLFFDRDGTYEDQICFERVYEAVDGIERVQVWRAVPISM